MQNKPVLKATLKIEVAFLFENRIKKTSFDSGGRCCVFKNIALLVCLSFFALHLTGCAAMVGAVAGGAGTSFWLSGKLSDEVNTPYERTIAATKKALSSLKMDIEKETRTDEVTQIISKHSDGSKVWIDIRPLTEKSSKIEVRVGIKGDKAASEMILERIKKNL